MRSLYRYLASAGNDRCLPAEINLYPSILFFVSHDVIHFGFNHEGTESTKECLIRIYFVFFVPLW